MNQHRTTAPVLHIHNGRLELHFARPSYCNKVEDGVTVENVARAWQNWLRLNMHEYPPGTSFHLVTTREKSSN